MHKHVDNGVLGIDPFVLSRLLVRLLHFKCLDASATQAQLYMPQNQERLNLSSGPEERHLYHCSLTHMAYACWQLGQDASQGHMFKFDVLPHENWPVLNNYLNTWTAVMLPPTRACAWWRLTCTLLSLTATDIVIIIGISIVSSQNARAQAKCLLCWVPC